MKLLLQTLLVFFLPSFLIAQPTAWNSAGIGGGGALFAPSISPLDADNIYMQCDMTEVFHSTDAGLNWGQVHFTQLISTGGQHTVEFTNDPDILYTVNLDFITDERFPVKSIDGGATWQSLASDPTGADVWFISSDPNSTQRILLSSYTELFISTNGGTSFSSAYDLGSDFLISGAFWSGDSIFVGTNVGLIVSTDGGANFSVDASSGIPAGEGFISFTGSQTGSTVRLMATTADQFDLYPGINALDIYIYSTTIKLDYGLGNWTDISGDFNIDHPLFIISSSLSDINTFYVGGTDVNTSYPVVYKTINGGTNWNEVFLTTSNQNIATGYSGYNGDEDWYYGEIVFGLDVAPNDANTVIFTDFGFAHITTNGGTSWKQAYVESADENPEGSDTPEDLSYGSNGLENTSCWNLHWSDVDNIFASYTDITGTRSTDGGASWAFDYTGVPYNTIYHVVEHPTTGTLYAAVSSVHDLYQSTYLTDAQINGGSGAILFSTDLGVTWQMLENFAHPVIWLAIDPNNTDRMYASVVHSTLGGIFRTDDLNNGVGAAWSNTTAPARTEGHPYNIFVLDDGTVVSTWCGRRAPSFTASSGVFSSDDLGVSWTDLSENDDMYYWTKDITIDPNDAAQNTWYVSVFSGWGGPANDKGGLFKTTNRGQNWVLFYDSYRVESATVNPTNADEVYFTTENEGLWYSENATSATPTFTQLFEYSFQHPMRVFYNPFDSEEIWVSSFGNGLKKGTTTTGPSGILSNETSQISIYPNPAGTFFNVSNASEICEYKLIDQLGRLVIIMSTGNTNSFSVNSENCQSGIYFLTLYNSNGDFSTHKIVVE